MTLTGAQPDMPGRAPLRVGPAPARLRDVGVVARGVVMVLLALMAAIPGAGPVVAEEVSVATDQGLQDWVAGFRIRALAAGIEPGVFDGAMTGLRFRPEVLNHDLHQFEFSKTVWDYLDKAVSEDRIASGRVALAKNRAVLERISATYQVDPAVIVAIWGLESAYGQVRGDFGTVEALATLAYAGRRQVFFETQLFAALRILQAGDVQAAQMKGSWAGAMGHTQFMPGTYLEQAVDFDGDGKRDIWGSDPTDALASTAAFLARWGWVKGQPWGVEVTLPQGFDLLQVGEKIRRGPEEWAALGVTRVGGGALPDALGSVLLPGGARGAAFVIYGNFQVLEHYNTADAYVIAVGHLADRILGGPAIAASWPRDLRALTFAERVELQDLLTAAGFDAGGSDGRIGPKTIGAIRGFQRTHGILPDGYASLDVVGRLRVGGGPL